MTPEPGWYDDPAGKHEKRRFDGSDWTDEVRDGDHLKEDPIAAYAATARERSGSASAGGAAAGLTPPGGGEPTRPWIPWVVAGIVGLFIGVAVGAAGGGTQTKTETEAAAAAQTVTETGETKTVTGKTRTVTKRKTVTEAAAATPAPSAAGGSGSGGGRSFSGNGGKTLKPFTTDGPATAWVVRWAGEGDFAAGDARYYASPERAALPWDPREAIERAELRLLEPYSP